MRKKNFQRTANLTLLSLICLFAWGCSSGTDSASQPSVNPNTPKTAAAQTQNPLVGVWFGTPTLNRVTLQSKIDQAADPNEKQQLQVMAQSFLSIRVGAKFGDDGSMVFDVEMQGVDGQYHRDSSQGSWQLVSFDDHTMVIEKTEEYADGSTTTQQDRYNFINDNANFAMSLPTAPALKECNPIILFERTNVDDPAKVAEQPGSNGQFQ